MNISEEQTRLKKILSSIGLPEPQENQWILSGSGILVMHGVERDRPMGDVDIFCATRTWFRLYHEGIVGVMNPESDSAPWRVWTTDPADPMRRSDPPYLYKTIEGLEANIFHGWRKRGIGDIDVAFWLNNPEIIDGVPCIPVQFLLDWKEQMGRAKDQTDIERIKKYLAGR